jgi:ABC-type protease/lipase transport system fused ATPase/permease subunit
MNQEVLSRTRKALFPVINIPFIANLLLLLLLLLYFCEERVYIYIFHVKCLSTTLKFSMFASSMILGIQKHLRNVQAFVSTHTISKCHRHYSSRLLFSAVRPKSKENFLTLKYHLQVLI